MGQTAVLEPDVLPARLSRRYSLRRYDGVALAVMVVEERQRYRPYLSDGGECSAHARCQRKTGRQSRASIEDYENVSQTLPEVIN